MAEKARCEDCDRNFKDLDSLAMHNKSKHPQRVKKKRESTLVRYRTGTIVIVILGLIVLAFITIIPENNVKELHVNLDEKFVSIPLGEVHWHPKLTLEINGDTIKIPTDIGYRIGKTVDTHLSGMKMSPTHTHETDGTIHLENNNPSSKPETLTLGYFFYVWDKQFNASCIFEYCTDKGELKMYVNGEENNEFENYIMRDKDDIFIKYTSD